MGNRVSVERIEDLMSKLTPRYSIVEGTTTTVCLLQLPNGFVVGEGFSACVDPSNFNEELGRKYSLENATEHAKNKLWEFEGYLLAMTLNPV